MLDARRAHGHFGQDRDGLLRARVRGEERYGGTRSEA
jgi:hypothetical protein